MIILFSGHSPFKLPKFLLINIVPAGYRYFLISCIDINECLEQDDACADKQICVNLDGSFQCQSPDEFKVKFTFFVTELGTRQFVICATTTTRQCNRASVTSKNLKNFMASVSEQSSHNEWRHNAFINKMAWKHGHVVAAVMSLVQLCFSIFFLEK